MNLNEFFNDLAANGSRNYKIERLEANRNDEQLREVIRLALDPFTQFYIRKIPKYECNATKPASLNFAINELYTFSSRSVTGNAAIDRLSNLLSALSEDDAKVIERIIQKDLKCGVSVSTANTVWTGLVNDYPVMLCSPFEQKLVDKIKFPASVQLKMDGMRFNAIVRDGKVEYRSRNGKEIQLLGNLDDDFITLADGVDCVFDGELLVVDSTGNILDRQTGNGILNKANKGTISPADAAKVRATVWDYIPYLYFIEGEYNKPYLNRFAVLADKVMPAKIKLVESTGVNSIEEANVIFEKYLSEGQEGIILKDLSGIWENKRAKHQIKFKGEQECDLEIVSVEEGTGKYAGKLGAVVCRSRPEDGKFLTVNVGSGFNDAQRDNLWATRDTLVGRIVAVKYNMRSKNKAGEESLFLPIFVEVRDDKDVADTLGDIK